MLDTPKVENIDSILKSFKKEFGDSIEVASKIKFNGSVVKTGVLTIDLALGVGGIPLGKIVELYGQESSGKTTLSLLLIKQAQAMGLLTALIDAKSSFDPAWAATLGVNLESLLVIEPDSLEDALSKLEFLVSKGVQFIVFDSVPAAPAASENQGDFGDSHVGVRARILSSALAVLTPKLRDNQATVLFINQIREKIGVYGNPETTPGGRALKFFSSIRINLRKKQVKDKEEAVGDEILAIIEKNKFAPPGKRAKFILMYDGNITINYVEILSSLGYLEKAGAWFYMKLPGEDEKKFHGSNEVMSYVLENEQVQKRIEELLLQKKADFLEKSENED